MWKFYLNPLNWALKGKAKLEALAYHTLSGPDLSLELTRIHYLDPATLTVKDQEAYEKDCLVIRKNHGLITDEEFDRGNAAFIKDERERKIEELNIDLRYKKVDKTTHAREVATLKGEPWVGCVDDRFEYQQGVNGYFFQMDWNEHFPNMLRQNGYAGTDDEVVTMWFDDVTKEVRDEFDGPSLYRPKKTSENGMDIYS